MFLVYANSLMLLKKRKKAKKFGKSEGFLESFSCGYSALGEYGAIVRNHIHLMYTIQLNLIEVFDKTCNF